MTSKELFSALRGSGTGVSKLDIAKNTGIEDAHDLIDAMVGKWPEDTLTKAREFAGPRPPVVAPVVEAKPTAKSASATKHETANADKPDKA